MGAQNVEISADRPRMSTFCALYATNVEVRRRGAGNSTFCALLPGFPSMPPFSDAGATAAVASPAYRAPCRIAEFAARVASHRGALPRVSPRGARRARFRRAGAGNGGMRGRAHGDAERREIG
jgi:hypothetical protein